MDDGLLYLGFSVFLSSVTTVFMIVIALYVLTAIISISVTAIKYFLKSKKNLNEDQHENIN